MMILRKRILLLTLALSLLLVPCAGAAAENHDDNGMPEISLPELLSIVEGAKGKVVLLNYFATWCPPCKEEIPGLIAIRKDVPEDKLLLIGLSVDEDLNDLRKYARKIGFNYPVRVADASVVRWAGVSGIPHLVIFDKQGALQVNEAGLVEEKVLRAFLQELMEQ
ncbi:TlpA family protein disulfide reductase [Desulfovibrio sp. OttesenSCG-928-I05]|nr:TlpA family protein disulfide reductase [Desulfovibrio sp. OttesenSCG-928-I05]